MFPKPGHGNIFYAVKIMTEQVWSDVQEVQAVGRCRTEVSEQC